MQLNRLKEVLNEQGRRQNWLAAQIGIATKTISFWCTNKTQPDLENLHEIANILGINPADLIGDGKEIKEEN